MMMSRELEMKCAWHSITTDCPLSHGLFVSLSHCPSPESPIVPLFIVPSSTAPPSHVVPLSIVPLTIVRLSIVQVSQFPHCHLPDYPMVALFTVPLSFVLLSHRPVSIVPLSDCPLSPVSHGCIGLRRRGLQVRVLRGPFLLFSHSSRGMSVASVRYEKLANR
jgi:hypothetical protein